MAPRPSELARFFDHTQLKPTASAAMIETLCDQARDHGFFSVCVNPRFVPLAVKRLEGSETVVCTVVGFPLGATSSEVKALETRWCIDAGAQEIDMVLSQGALLEGDDETVTADIRGVVQAAQGALVKVILETAALGGVAIDRACACSEAAGAHFVKTSTGFGPGGASVEAVARMRKAVGDRLGVKASGGIRTLADARAMIDAGATRLGASASVEIIKQQEQS